ncbi:Dynein heavy chain family protein [Trichomonas vaginalis G3]|uniref:Dynein heavy chain family protein n=1 Tax=Trichomonas vaginalis (strain ATCC PRA-98 / G3) TaxID=412133 RepID=A2EIE2_TRIV3|nr:dynein heavy chain family protein family [Trichomonas vaginalis G3]EAY07547.1 Dynein heavy chain family protein [Trichomonas vaginalis G3]KAI5541247.1 dynein heavy chain family protein family [Trichomonas vaginalis G3]|eukprot:XP_001319770.1 Dynein heavy chain family protein [Trichomonas vaginalis G3]
MQVEKYDYAAPAVNESRSIIEGTNPKLRAYMNSKKFTRPKTSKEIKKPIMVYEQEQHPFVNQSFIIKRPFTPSRAAPPLTRTSIETGDREEAEVAFTEDPLAYFSKHKDGSGHKFIYLNYSKDPSDPQYSPYDLEITTYADLKDNYCIMSADGIQIVGSDGTTFSQSLHQWASEKSHFISLRKLKFFSMYYIWKPFTLWKVYIMKMRYQVFTKAIATKPIVLNTGFAQTTMKILEIFVDQHKKLYLDEVIKRFLLIFRAQSQFIIPNFKSKTEDNFSTLSAFYRNYHQEIVNKFLEFDNKVRDPAKIIVKDSDIKTFKRKNPNLGQLMVLEKEKAEKRVKRTIKVNNQILSYANYLRSLDYMLLEEQAQAILGSWKQAHEVFKTKNCALFQAELIFTDDGQISLEPSLQELLDTISNAFSSAISLVTGFPRLIMAVELRPHIKQSIPNFRELIENGPNLLKILAPYPEINDIEEDCLNIMEKSYKDALVAIQVFKELYSIHKLDETFHIEDYIKSKTNKPAKPLNYQLTDNGNQELDIDFDVEPYMDIKTMRKFAEQFMDYEKRIAKLVPIATGTLFVESRTLKRRLEPIPQAKFNIVFETLKKLLDGKSDRIYTMLSSYQLKLQVQPSTLETYVQLCTTIDKVNKFLGKIQEEIEYTNELYHIFVQYGVHLDASKSSGFSLQQIYSNFTKVLEASATMRRNNRQSFISELIPQATNIEEKIATYIDMASKIPISIELCNIEVLKKTLANIQEKINKLKPKVQKFSLYQDVLNTKTTNFESLGKLIKIMSFVTKLYDCVERWTKVDQSSIRNVFWLVDIDALSNEIIEIENICRDLIYEQPFQTTLLDEITSKLKTISPYLTQLKLLSAHEMLPRHWAKLFEECKLPNIYKTDMRLDELLASGVMDYANKIDEITDIAQREEKVEAEFNGILKGWNAVQLPVVSGQQKVEDNILLTDTSELITKIDDSIISLEAMLSLPFAHGVEEQVSLLLKQLNDCSNILNIWSSFQANWVFLRSLFNNENGKSIPSQLTSQFSNVRRKWSSCVAHIHKDFSLINACSYPNLYQIIYDCNNSLVSILSNLKTYADSKCTFFPRLFLMGTNDIVTLSALNDINSVKFIAARLFMKCSNLICPETGLTRIKIKGIQGNDGHILHFIKHVQVQGQIESWLQHVVESMNQALIENVATSYARVAQLRLSDWIFQYPKHVVMLVLCASFTMEVEYCFSSDNVQKAITTLKDSINNKKVDLINIFEMKTDYFSRGMISMVIIILSNQISILSDMEKTNVPDVLWASYPNYKFSVSEKTFIITYNGKTIPFENEYWGDVRPFIRTQATEKVYNSIFMCECPLLVGSSSTGRKTIVEHAAALLGKIVVDCPALSSLSIYQLRQLLLGTVVTGAWCLFKEVNSFSIPSLNIITDFIQLYMASNALGINSMTYEGFNKGIIPTSKFIFFDEGNTAEIPNVLRNSLFKVALINPDLQAVIEIKLSASGFKFADTCAVKLASTINAISGIMKLNLKTSASLANAMRIIKMSITIKDEMRESTQSFLTASERAFEEFIVAKACYWLYQGIIDEPIHDLLMRLMFDGFRTHDTLEAFSKNIVLPVIDNPAHIDQLIMKRTMAITNGPQELKDYLADKALMLHKILKHNRCVIIYGPIKSGKSLLVRTLLKVYDDLLNGNGIDEKVPTAPQFSPEFIFPTILPYDSTYGYVKNEGTSEEQWIYGYMNQLFNTMNLYNTDKQKLLVFDGILNTKFNEFLIEIASQHTAHTQSLDTVDTSDRSRIIVITESLNNITPSMISCCTLLHMNRLNEFDEGAVCELQFPALVNYNIFPSNYRNEVGPAFEEYIAKTMDHCLKLPDISFNKYIPNPKLYHFVMQNLFPQTICRYIKALLDNDQIELSPNGIKSAFVIAVERFFDGILIDIAMSQLHSWLYGTFGVVVDTNWQRQEVSEEFRKYYPKPLFAVFVPFRKHNHIIDQSDLVYLETKEIHEPRNVVIPTGDTIVNNDTLNFLINNKNDVAIIGESSNTLVKYFSKQRTDLSVYIYNVDINTTSNSLLGTIKIHSELSMRRTTKTKPSVIIIEDIDQGSEQVQELVRYLVYKRLIPLKPSASRSLVKPIDLKQTQFIITAKNIVSISQRLITKFCVIFSKPISRDITFLLAEKIFTRCQVNQPFIKKMIKMFQDFLQDCPEAPFSFRELLNWTYSVCILNVRQSETQTDEIHLIAALYQDLILYLPQYKKSITTNFIKNFKNFNKEHNINIQNHITSVIYTIPDAGVPYSSVEYSTTKQLIDETIDYIAQFNAASYEKVPIFVSTNLVYIMNQIKRVLLFPGGSCVLIGKPGSGRYSLLRIVTNMCKYDIIQINDSAYRPTMKEIINTVVTYHKSFVLYLRSNELEVPENIKSLITFAKTRDFSVFFDEKELQEVYHNASNSCKMVTAKKTTIRDMIVRTLSSNLHIVISRNDKSQDINWQDAVKITLPPVSEDDLLEITTKYILTDNNKVIFGSFGSLFPKFFRSLHSIVLELDPNISPNSYFDLLRTFNDQLIMRYNETISTMNAKTKALNFISTVNDEINRTTRKLDDLRTPLENARLESESSLRSYQYKMDAIQSMDVKFNSQKKVKEDALNELKKQSNLDKEEVQSCQRRILETQKQIDKMTQNDVETIRIGALNPTNAFMRTIEILCMYKGYHFSYEVGGVKLLQEEKLLDILHSPIAYENIDSRITSRAYEVFNDETFTRKDVEDISPPVLLIYDWLFAIVQFSRAQSAYANTYQSYINFQRTYDEFIADLKAQEQSIQHIRQTIDDDKAYLTDASQKFKNLEQAYNLELDRKTKCEYIVNNIDQIVKKWREDIQFVTNVSKTTIIITLLYSFYISYCGQFEMKVRKGLIAKVANEICRFRLTDNIMEPMSIIKDMLMKDVGIDRASKGTSYKMNTSKVHSLVSPRIPLIMDCNGLFIKDLCDSYKSPVNVASLHNSDIGQTIIDNLESGKVLIITDVCELTVTLQKIMSIYIMRNDENVSKSIQINNRTVKWNSGFRLILATNYKAIPAIPAELQCRTTIINCKEELEFTMQQIILSKFIGSYDSMSLKDFSESLVPLTSLRSSEADEESLALTLTDLGEFAKNSGLGFAINHELKEKADQLKTRLNDIESAYNKAIELKEKVNLFSEKYRPMVNYVSIFWKALVYSVESLGESFHIPFNSFIGVLQQVLKHPTVTNDKLTDEITTTLTDLFSKAVVQWISPMLSVKHSYVYMFYVTIFFSIFEGKLTNDSLGILATRIKEVNSRSYNGVVNDLLGDPVSLIISSAESTSIYALLSRTVSSRFGLDFMNSVQPFQPDSVMMQAPGTPCIIITPPGDDPVMPVMNNISTRSRNDMIENLTICSNSNILKRAKKILQVAMSRGNRIMLHCADDSHEVTSFIADTCNIMNATTVNSNFRLIIVASTSSTIPNFVLSMSKRLFYSNEISWRQTMHLMFTSLAATLKYYNTNNSFKKLTYSVSLCLSLLKQRELMFPAAFEDKLDFTDNTFNSFFNRVKSFIDPSLPIPVFILRDILSTNMLATGTSSILDARKIKTLVSRAINQTLIAENFTLSDKEDNPDKNLEIPNEIKVSQIATKINELPSFAPYEGFDMDRSIAHQFRQFALSRWISEGILDIKPFIPLQVASYANMIEIVRKTATSVPEALHDPKTNIAKTAQGAVLRGELLQFNEFIVEVKKTLLSPEINKYIVSFSKREVPADWAQRSGYYREGDHEDFVNFLSEKRKVLGDWLNQRKCTSIDLKYINNASGLLNAFLLDGANSKGIAASAAMLNFDIGGMKVSQNILTITGLTLVGGIWTAEGISTSTAGSAINPFPDINVTVSKKSSSTAKLYQCPLLRTVSSQKRSYPLIDGNSNNIISYIPVKSPSTVHRLVNDGVSLIISPPVYIVPESQ